MKSVRDFFHSSFQILTGFNQFFCEIYQFRNHGFVVFQLYNKMREWTTPSGFTLDQCIQTGVDNPGIKHYEKTTGIVAGDEESYEVTWYCADLGHCIGVMIFWERDELKKNS